MFSCSNLPKEETRIDHVVYTSKMVVRVVELLSGGTKLERCLPKKQHTQKKFLNSEDWCSGELSKIGHDVGIKLI